MNYLLFDEWGGIPRDAKKTVLETEDDLMCWAAAASNVLAWTGWGFPEGQSFQDEASIFRHFQDHWRDAVGYPNFAWQWWFAGGDQNYPNVDVPGGGGFLDSVQYPFEDFNHVEEFRPEVLSAIDDFLHRGYGVVLELIGQQNGHYITCWGYEQDEDGRYLGIYTTDSDDPLQDLRYYEIHQDTSGTEEWARYPNWWYFTYRNGSTRYLLGKVHALDRRPQINPPRNLKAR